MSNFWCQLLAYSFVILALIWILLEYDVLRNKTVTVARRSGRYLGAGIGFGFVLVACSSATYRFYSVDIEQQKFLGQNGNMTFDDCRKKVNPTTGKLGYPCIMVPVDEYTRLRNAWDRNKELLIDCQKKH